MSRRRRLAAGAWWLWNVCAIAVQCIGSRSECQASEGESLTRMRCGISRGLYYLLIFLFSALCTADDYPLGPMQLPAIGMMESFRAVEPFLLTPPKSTGTLDITTTLRWLNIWALHQEKNRLVQEIHAMQPNPFSYGSFLLDLEVLDLAIHLCFHIREHMVFDMNFPIRQLSGGILDGFIEGFHTAFGINQHDRDNWPRNRSQFLFFRRNGYFERYDESNLPELLFGNISCGIYHRFATCNPDFSYRLSCSLPSYPEDTLFQAEGMNFSLQLMTAYRSGWMNLYAGIGNTRYISQGNREISFKPSRFSLFGELQFPIRTQTSVCLHGVWGGPLASYPQLDEPDVEFTLGIVHRFRHGIFEFGLIENMFYYDNSPDFGIHTGWTFTL